MTFINRKQFLVVLKLELDNKVYNCQTLSLFFLVDFVAGIKNVKLFNKLYPEKSSHPELF